MTYCLGLLYLCFYDMTWAFTSCTSVVSFRLISVKCKFGFNFVIAQTSLVIYEELVGLSFRHSLLIFDQKAGDYTISVVTKKVCKWDKWLNLSEMLHKPIY